MSASTRPIKLSPKESELFALLPRSGERVNTNQLVNLYYVGEDDIPFHARAIINGRMRSIMAKLGPERVATAGRRGPYPAEYWLVR